MNDPVAAALALLTALSARQSFDFLMIGGLPRSGTSSCERILHSLPTSFITDEFHGLNRLEYLPALRWLHGHFVEEASIWCDDNGRTWRGLSVDEQKSRLCYTLLAQLLLHTRPEKFMKKEFQNISLVGLKLPLIEASFDSVWPLFETEPPPFIYCARDPVAILLSHWNMPWVTEEDPRRFAQQRVDEIQWSIYSFRRVLSTGARTSIWRTPISTEDVGTVLRELGLPYYFRMPSDGTLAILHVDEWPQKRRRKTLAIEPNVINWFEQQQAVIEYRELFSV